MRQLSNRTVCLGVIHHGVYLCLLCSNVFLFFPQNKSELVKRNDDVGHKAWQAVFKSYQKDEDYQYIPMPTLCPIDRTCKGIQEASWLPLAVYWFPLSAEY
jgi:hypothetical protein